MPSRRGVTRRPSSAGGRERRSRQCAERRVSCPISRPGSGVRDQCSNYWVRSRWGDSSSLQHKKTDGTSLTPRTELRAAGHPTLTSTVNSLNANAGIGKAGAAGGAQRFGVDLMPPQSRHLSRAREAVRDGKEASAASRALRHSARGRRTRKRSEKQTRCGRLGCVRCAAPAGTRLGD